MFNTAAKFCLVMAASSIQNFSYLDYLNNSDIEDNDDNSDNSCDSEEETGDIEEESETISENGWHLVTRETDIPPEFKQFYGISGPTSVESLDGHTELDYGNMCLTDGLMHMLAYFTNVRAHQCSDSFREVTLPEMRKFLALTLLMGIVKKPRIRDYWSTNPLLEMPIFASENSLSRDRYFEILRFIRFGDYSQEFDLLNDPLAKMRPFIDEVQHICKSSYLPYQDISIDETLLLFKGRLVFRQYLPSKRSRYGIKTFALCDSKNGYFWNFITYVTASKMDFCIPHAITDPLSMTEKLVVHLSSPLFGLNYHLTTDNYFTSLRVAQILYQNGMSFSGTWRSNRGVPTTLQKKTQAANSSMFMRKNEVLAVKWTEKKSSAKKDIFLIDTKGCASTERVLRRKKGGAAEEVFKPTTVLRYNKNMGGVDRSDSTCERYDPTRKSLNWMVKYGIHLIHRLLINSHVIYTESGGELTLLDFTLKYVEQTLKSTGSGRRSLAKRVRTKGHQPVVIPPTAKKNKPTRKCRLCSKNNHRKESRYMCPDCPSSPALCVTCFSEFHR